MQCGACNRSFANENNLRRHIRGACVKSVQLELKEARKQLAEAQERLAGRERAGDHFCPAADVLLFDGKPISKLLSGSPMNGMMKMIRMVYVGKLYSVRSSSGKLETFNGVEWVSRDSKDVIGNIMEHFVQYICDFYHNVPYEEKVKFDNLENFLARIENKDEHLMEILNRDIFALFTN